MRLIIGLGNPGIEYSKTRHNLGFKVIDQLCVQSNISLKSSPQAKGLFAKSKIEDSDVMFFLPFTYMNNSGSAIKRVVEKNEVEIKNILVVCDDFNIDFCKIRIRAKGSDGGHNGLASIIHQLNSEDFPRLRLGIGLPPGKKRTSDFVLEEFDKKEKEEVEFLIRDGADCCVEWVKHGINKAMEQFNKKASSS